MTANEPLLSESKTRGRLSQIALSTAVFIGAWLLFAVEPLTGKMLTPILGGTSEVWLVCLLFFQLVVLGGYFLTFVMAKMQPRQQVIFYLTIFALSLYFARIPAADSWGFGFAANPTWELLAKLTRHLGVPLLLLSSLSGSMQVWQARAGETNPYRLYALSNLGSFGALIAYPTLIEPNLPVSATLKLWAIGYYFLSASIVVTAASLWKHNRVEMSAPEKKAQQDTPKQLEASSVWRWLFLSTLSSAALLAFTSYLTTDLTPVPLLWIVPLAIYLWTFTVAFSKTEVKTRPLIFAWLPLVFIDACASDVAVVVGLAANLAMLYVLCMVCTAKLAESKPDVLHLPTFYLAIAGGGVIGGLLIAIGAPLCLTFVGERICVIIAFTLYLLYAGQTLNRQQLNNRLALSGVVVAVAVWWLTHQSMIALHQERNFFGSATVKVDGDMLCLYHGRINHGAQYLDPAKAIVTAYPYGAPSLLALDFVHTLHKGEPLRLAVIGLGTGSMSMEAHAGDSVDFFEIDPKIIAIARKYFRFLSSSKASVSIELGDGRLLLKKSDQRYDAICVDAFNGDAIPVHLLTLEAFRLYLERLKPHGFIILHITNSYVDLAPIVGNAATELGLQSCLLVYHRGIKYAVLTRDASDMSQLVEFAQKNGPILSVSLTKLPQHRGLRLWTDDFSNLFSVLKWNHSL